MKTKTWRISIISVALAIALVPTMAFASGSDATDPAPSQVSEGSTPSSLSKKPSEPNATTYANEENSPAPSSTGSFEARGAVYPVATLEQLHDAMQRIADSGAAVATIQLSADLKSEQSAAGEPFTGMPSTTIMISSEDGACHDFYLDNELKGGIVLDNVSASFKKMTVFANGNPFETTERFSGTINTLYGGGSAGNDISSDADITLRGGKVMLLYGGGLDSDLKGNVHITIDAPTTPGTLPSAQTVSNFHGGGHAKETDKGRVSGDVTIDFRSGSNASFFGGGLNDYDQDATKTANPAAMVSGTVTVNFGYEGAPSRSVWPGLAMYSYAGSEYSTVGNTRLNLLDGCTDNGDRNFYGCGYNDTVLGTVEVIVEGNVDLNSGFIHYGGDTDRGYYVDGNVNILNQNKEKYAVHTRWNTSMENLDNYSWTGVQANEEDVPLTINGDVLVDVESGYLAFAKLDSENSSAVINGDSTIRVKGDAKIAQIEGNEREYSSEDESHKTTVLYDGADCTAAYHYFFDEVKVTNGSRVLVDGDTDLFPMFGDSVQNPFYSVKDLVVNEASSITTRDSNTMLKRNVVMNNGTWHAQGYTYVYEAMSTKDSSIFWDTYYQVGYAHRDDSDPAAITAWESSEDTVVTGYSGFLNKIYGNVDVTNGTWSLLNRTGVVGNFASDELTLQLPVIAEGTNYPAKSVPLAIDGISNGHADVVTVSREGLVDTMDASTWKGAAVVPTLTENYITSWAPHGVGDQESQDNPTQAVFTLSSKVQGPDAYFLKRLPDADDQYASDYYMWQVADGFVVTFDKNTTDEGSMEADPNTIAIASNPGDRIALGKLPATDPVRPGYVFEGWFNNPEGTGDRITESTLVDSDVTFYAKWAKEEVPPAPDPDPEIDNDAGPENGNSGIPDKGVDGSEENSDDALTPKTSDQAGAAAVGILALGAICATITAILASKALRRRKEN